MIKAKKLREAVKSKLKKGDTIKVIAGRSRGKTGKILRVAPAEGRAVVEGVNLIKKHSRRTRDDQQGGIVTKEGPVSLSNLLFLCPRCNRPSRIGIKTLTDGSRSRFCKRCSETI